MTLAWQLGEPLDDEELPEVDELLLEEVLGSSPEHAINTVVATNMSERKAS